MPKKSSINLNFFAILLKNHSCLSTYNGTELQVKKTYTKEQIVTYRCNTLTVYPVNAGKLNLSKIKPSKNKNSMSIYILLKCIYCKFQSYWCRHFVTFFECHRSLNKINNK